MNTQLVNDTISFLCDKNKKERLCHVQYVHKISLDLQKRYGGDPLVVSISSILHDVGRGREAEGESHEITGGRITKKYLNNVSGLNNQQKELIVKCVLGHGSTNRTRTVEEKIITTADSASKILYHNFFMLMCKKEDYKERTKRGYKYVEKGYKKIMFEGYKNELTNKYIQLKKEYLDIIAHAEG